MNRGSADTQNPSTTPPTEPSMPVLQAQGEVLANHDRLLREASTVFQALSNRLQAQESLQQERSSQVQNLTTVIEALAAQVAALTAAGPSPAAPAPVSPPSYAPSTGPPREPSLASPRPFDRTFAMFRGFLMQCELMFTHQPSQFFSPAARVAFITNLTTGDALNWVQATLSARPGLYRDYETFLTEFRRVFDHPTAGRDVGAQLMLLHQGNRTAAAYSTEFRTLAAGSGWNDDGLMSAFRQGLSESIKDELVRDKPTTLDNLVALAIDVDERVRERRIERARYQTSSPRPHSAIPRSSPAGANFSSAREPTNTTLSSEEPMQIGRASLSAAEKERRRAQGLCLYCGMTGHIRNACPSLQKD